MSDFYWPETPGVYEVCDSRGQPDRLTFDGQYWTRPGVATSYSAECLERNFFYLGVRREPARPMAEDKEDKATAEQDNYEAANLAIDEWRTIQHKPAEVERWAYRWARP
jgi:hypothetical protein